MRRRGEQLVALPELFLGLLSIGAAVVLTALIISGTVHDARQRAEILVHGLRGKLGAMRSSSLGVYQITPRDSTEISDYGVNDTSSREKDVTAVVSATFAVKS